MSTPRLSHIPSNAGMPPMTASDRAVLRYTLNRRRFLTMLGSAGVLGAAGCATSQADRSADSAAATRSTARGAGAEPDGSEPNVESSEPVRRSVDQKRQVVVIELSGGNDGLAMLQPFESGILKDARSNLVSEDADLIDAGTGLGWHPNLAGLADLGIAAAVGVGSDDPDFSHFEMEQRWWRGDSSDNSRIATGFFGRICDELDQGAPVTGLSLSGGPTPALNCDRSVTVGLADPGTSWFFREEEPWFNTLRQTLGAMSEPSDADSARFTAARHGLADTLRFAESLSEVPDSDDSVYPWTDLGQQLRLAAEVLDLDVGVRVMHVRQDGFDTHTGQQWRHGDLMTELNDATVAFVNDMQKRGRLDDTLVVTTSEFGRRLPQNDGGTDHGGASTMLVKAPSSKGVHGDAPNLAKLDDDNLVATARFEDYYATIAEDWFGIAASDVLPTGTPITGLI